MQHRILLGNLEIFLYYIDVCLFSELVISDFVSDPWMKSGVIEMFPGAREPDAGVLDKIIESANPAQLS